MYFVVLYFDSSKRQQSLTEHLNVRGAQRFQTPSYILSPLDSGPRHKFSRMTISFSPFLPFRSFENTAGNGGTFFYLSNTTAISQCNVAGLHEIYIIRGTVDSDNSLTWANAPARGGSITTKSYLFSIFAVNGFLNKSR